MPIALLGVRLLLVLLVGETLIARLLRCLETLVGCGSLRWRRWHLKQDATRVIRDVS
jgi:hypothetical protein